MTKCSLCNVIDFNSKKSIVNRIIFEWNNFVLIPSIGPLDVGHFLIVSRKHNCGLATMPKEDIQDFFRFSDFIKSKLPLSDLLFFEHGSYDNQDAGSCISHTHIHVIPGYSGCYAILDKSLEIVYEDFTGKQFSEIDFPYILTFNSANQSRIYRAYNVHSQMMRKAICYEKELVNWDWKTDKKINSVKEGIDFWTKSLNQTFKMEKQLY